MTPTNAPERGVKFVTLLESDLPKHGFSGWLGRRTTYSLNVTGPLGKREVQHLVTILQAHLDIGVFDDEPEAKSESTSESAKP